LYSPCYCTKARTELEVYLRIATPTYVFLGGEHEVRTYVRRFFRVS